MRTSLDPPRERAGLPLMALECGGRDKGRNSQRAGPSAGMSSTALSDPPKALADRDDRFESSGRRKDEIRMKIGCKDARRSLHCIVIRRAAPASRLVAERVLAVKTNPSQEDPALRHSMEREIGTMVNPPRSCRAGEGASPGN
jgi:hypothetical protein